MQSNNTCKKALTTAVALASLGTLSLAHSSVLEEITVTAQKREQSLQDVGISVTAFSGDQIRDLGLTDSADLQNMTPGLVVMEFGGAPTVSIFSLRGVSQNDFGDHYESPNAVYLDGAYVSSMAAVGAQMFDVERAEVLRGPQGTLFGRNATGGLIHLISKQPTQEFEAYTDFTIGSYNLRKFEGAVNGGLTDTLAARLSLATNYTDGYIDNNGVGKAPSEAPEDASLNARLQFAYTPSDDLSFNLSLRHGQIDDAAVGIYDSEQALTNDNGEVIANPTLADYQGFCGAVFGFTPTATQNCFALEIPGDPQDATTDGDSFLDRTHQGVTLKAEMEFDGFTLTSITDYQDLEKRYLEDSDSSVLRAGHFTQNQDNRQFSQELQIQGGDDTLNWTAGIYYLDIEGDYFTGFDMTGAWGVRTENQFSLQTESLAVYGQMEYALREDLALTVGLRWTDDEQSIDFNPNCINDEANTEIFFLGCDFFFPLAESVQNTGFSGSQSDQDFAFKTQLDWRPDEDSLYYASISRGNKAGSFSASSFALLTGNEFGFDPEVLTSYEVGAKLTLGETTRFNSSVFYYDYQDYQAFTFENVATVLINVDAVIVGADFELQSSFEGGWDMLLGLSVLDTNAKDVPLPSGDIRDQEMGLAPEVSFNGLIRKGWQLSDGEFFVQLDASYVDERNLSTINHPGQVMEDYVLGNARAGYESTDGWSVAVFVNNVGDTEIEQYLFDETFVSGTILRGLAPPRMVGATFSYNWN